MHQSDVPTSQTAMISRYGALAALTLSIVMLAGAWQVIAAAVNPAGLEFPRSWLDFREGRSTGALEKQLDLRLPARTMLVDAANSVRYLLTGSGGEQVRPGKDGWLFLTEEFRYDADGPANLKVRAELLGAAARSLQSQGVKLIVAVVPDKARVYSSKLSNTRYPEYNRSRYADAVNAFEQQGVATVDLLQALVRAAAQGEVYYRTDTHWNQSGALVAAQAIASAIKQLEPALEKTSFNNRIGDHVERQGDLIRLMGLGDNFKMLGLLPDLEAPVVTEQTSAQSVGLFGDSAVPVVVTGTSYSLRANFVGYLQQAISCRVLSAAKDGGGFLQATTSYLKDDAFRSSKPKILVWEVPERFLWRALDDEKKWFDTLNWKADQ